MDDFFVIYAIGDYEYVRRVLEAIAMFGGTEGQNWMRLGTLGALMGLLITGLRTIVTGGREFEVQYVFVGIGLFLAMFGARVTVTIENAVPANNANPGSVSVVGERIPVDNVPFGPAVLGVMISGFGHELTELMEQAFGTTSGYTVSEGGFGLTLDLISLPTALMDARYVNDGQMGRYAETLRNYLTDCYLDKQTFDGKSGDELFREQDTCEALRYNSAWSTTEVVKLTTGKRIMLDCQTAFNEHLGCDGNGIDGTTISRHSLIDAALRPAARRGTLSGDEERPADAPPLATGALDDIASAFDSLGVDVDVEAIAFGALLVGNSTRAMSQAAMSSPQHMQTLMLSQASAQRATQWAAEETMFRRVMRPIMSFFEAMVYAVAPFMAFVLCLGRFGLGMVVKYLVLTIWVQLWLPVLAIINLYMNVQAVQALRGMAIAETGLTEPAQMLQFWGQSLEWIGTAGMLAAATPALTFMLIFGGAYSAQALAGRLQGGDHIAEKMVAPDAVTPGAVVNQSSQYNWSPGSGLTPTDYLQNQTQISLGSMTAKDERSTAMEAKSANASLSEAINQTLSASYTTGRTGSLGGNSNDTFGSGTNYTANGSRGDTTSTGTSIDLKDGSARGDARIETWSGSGGLTVGAGVDSSKTNSLSPSNSLPTGTPVESSSSKGSVKAGASFGGTITGAQVGTDQRSNSTERGAGRDDTAAVSLQRALQAGNSQQVAAALVAAYNDTNSGVAQALQENKGLQTAYDNAVSANKSHAEMDAVTASAAASRSITLSHAAEQIQDNVGPEGLRHLKSQALEAFGAPAWEEARAAVMREGVNGGRAGPATDAAAVAYLAANANGRSDLEGDARDDDFRRSVYRAMGFSREPLSEDAARGFSGISSEGPVQMKDLTFAPGTGDPGLHADTVRAQAHADVAAAKGQVLWTREEQQRAAETRFGAGGESAVVAGHIFEKAAIAQEAEQNLLRQAQSFDVNGAEYVRIASGVGSPVDENTVRWPKALEGGDLVSQAYERGYGGGWAHPDGMSREELYRGRAHAVAERLFPGDAQQQLAAAGYIMSDTEKGSESTWGALPPEERSVYEDAMRSQSDGWFASMRTALDDGDKDSPLAAGLRGTSEQRIGGGSPVSQALPSEPAGGRAGTNSIPAPDDTRTPGTYPPTINLQ